MHAENIDIRHARQKGMRGSLATALSERLMDRGNAPAIRDKDKVLSGHTFLERARDCAELLRETGLAPGSRVLVDMPRSCELAVVILGCVLAGAAYVPAPAGLTPKDCEIMAEQTGSSAIIGIGQTGRGLPSGTSLRRLPTRSASLTGSEYGTKTAGVHAPSEVYCVRTSGTTGAPKVVPIREGNLRAFLEAQATAIAIGPDRTWLWMHDLSFDLSVFEVFGSIWQGGCLLVLDAETKMDSAAIRRLVSEQAVNVLTTTPSEFRFILREGGAQTDIFRSMTHIVFCGEKLSGKTLAPVFEQLDSYGTKVFNAYGPSEATVFCMAHRVNRADLEKPSLPLGQMLPSMRGELREVQVDGTGELVLHGPQVFAGYDGCPLVTNGHPTGDICAHRSGEELVFLYRKGGFMKINGHRVDLAEIEEHLLRHPAVDEAVMLVTGEEDSAQLLNACVRSNDMSLDSRRLRAHAMALPAYLRPARYVLHTPDTWPITPHGKTDRTILKEQANDQH